MALRAQSAALRLARLAGGIAEDPLFDHALRSFCTSIGDWYRADRRLIEVFGDLGRIATVSTAFACQGTEGVNLATLIRHVAGNGLASSRRVRAICDNLERTGAATHENAAPRRREKPLRFGGWLERELLCWLGHRLAASQPWITRAAAPDADTLQAFMARSVRELLPILPQLSEDWSDVSFYLEHTGGYPFLLDMIRADWSAIPVSRKGLASTYGLSRPHVAALVAHGVREGWIELRGPNRSFALSPAARAQLRRWIAGEIAWTAIAVDGR